MKHLKPFTGFEHYLIKEALGIPQNIINVSNQLYDKIIPGIDPNDGLDELKQKQINIIGNFRVGDLDFKDASFRLSLREDDLPQQHLIHFISFSIRYTDFGEVNYQTQNIEPTLGVVPKIIVYLNFKITRDKSYHDRITGQVIREMIENNLELFRPSLSHEIKHIFDFFKKGKIRLSDLSMYGSYKFQNYGNEDLDLFFHMMYYVDHIENLVRTCEFGQDIIDRGILKKDFINYLNDEDNINFLRKMQTISFDQIYNKILDDQKKLYPNRNKNEFELKINVNMIFKRAFEYNKINRIDIFKMNILDQSELMNMFQNKYVDQEKLKAIERFEKQTDKLFKKDWKIFFTQAAEMIRKKSQETLRKIYKLYAIAKDDDQTKVPSSGEKIYNPQTKL